MICSFRDEDFFLSNFYPVEIKLDGIVYPNAEAAFQAQKTLDVEEEAGIFWLKPTSKCKTLNDLFTIYEAKIKIMFGSR